MTYAALYCVYDIDRSRLFEILRTYSSTLCRLRFIVGRPRLMNIQTYEWRETLNRSNAMCPVVDYWLLQCYSASITQKYRFKGYFSDWNRLLNEKWWQFSASLGQTHILLAFCMAKKWIFQIWWYFANACGNSNEVNDVIRTIHRKMYLLFALLYLRAKKVAVLMKF